METVKPLNGQKSFGGNAKAVIDGDEAILFSYDTPVAALIGDNFYRLWGGYSATTMRHVAAFCENYAASGVGVYHKADWSALPVYTMDDARKDANGRIAA